VIFIKFELLKELIKRVLNIKSIMAFILTLTFAILAIKNIITPSEFMTVFTAVVVYFFVDNKNNNGGNKNE
jgi:hypothetical protein